MAAEAANGVQYRLKIETLAQQWLELDQDEETHQEMEDIYTRRDYRELEDRLSSRIQFGTAGLRGRMEAGFSRMNSLTVIQATQGLAAYLLEQVEDAKTRGVIIGHDHRHNSAKFAALAANAFRTKGIRVLEMKKLVHTPLVPFTIKHTKAAAGIMITASHNPSKDNGYKVYWSNACQIVPPHDTGIAAEILLNLKPLQWAHPSLDDDDKDVTLTLDRAETAYFDSIAKLVGKTDLSPFTFTPMHGVGRPYMQKSIDRICLPTMSKKIMLTVPQQGEPDPDFSTVKFPNPEEKGALDLAIRSAYVEGTSLIIAVDPDADRLAVAQKLPSGLWHQFSGNQIGMLLASYVLSQYPQEKRKNMAMLNTTVSTSMLRAMAEVEGFNFVETLTGFKWLGNVAQNLQREKGWHVPFAFEEALGFMFTDVGHDKDGICAASVFLVAVEAWKTQNMTAWDKLQTLYNRYGYFEEANTYLITPSPATTNKIFQDVRHEYGQKPVLEYSVMMGKRKILRWRDLTVGFQSDSSYNIPDLPVDATSQMITCELEGGSRFTVRGSGTEPKIKIYIDSRGKSEVEARAEAFSVQVDLIKLWMKPSQNELKLP